MTLLVRIHVEVPGFLWEVLDRDQSTVHKGKTLFESLHLAPGHVKAQETARRQAARYVEEKFGTEAEYETTSEYAV